MKELPDIYYKKEWGKLYSEKDNGFSEEYRLENQYGTIIYPYIKRNIEQEPKYFDIITPYGFNGPMIVKSINKQKLLESYEQDFNVYCQENGIIAEYIRFSPWFKNHLDFSEFYNLKLNKKTIAMNLLVEDILMQEISAKRRNCIRSAIKNGVKIEFDFEGKTIDEFYKLYQNTIKKNEIKEYYWVSKEFLKKHFELLQNNVFIVNAIYENKIISSSIFLHCNKQLHYHYSANDYEYVNLNGNSLILYEVAKWGKQNGKERLNLGGASISDNLMKFKLSFTKDEGFDYYIGTRIRQEHIYNELVKRTKKENSKYFPKYRGE